MSVTVVALQTTPLGARSWIISQQQPKLERSQVVLHGARDRTVRRLTGKHGTGYYTLLRRYGAHYDSRE